MRYLYLLFEVFKAGKCDRAWRDVSYLNEHSLSFDCP
jgi:hypothetical protein